MSQDLKEYLDKVSLEKFESIIPTRRSIIEAADDKLPQYRHNANIVAEALHPEKQFVSISKVVDREDAKSYILVPDGETKALAYFSAGQYISVELQIGDSVLTRPFTIASSPSDALKGSYTLTIKKVADGFASNYILENWKVGTKLTISAPEGEFYYEPLRDAKKVLAIAGGSGITPFISMMNAVNESLEKFSITLLYGCRTEDSILYRKELDELVAKCENCKVVYVLSDEEKDGYEHGFINAAIINRYAPKEDYSAFLCGPRVMINFAEKELTSLGVPKRRIRCELPGEYKNADKDKNFPKEAINQSFLLTVVTSDGEKKVIEAKSSESILVAMERAGIKAPSRCRSGECGFCRTRLVSGSYYVPDQYEHRRGADIADEYIHPCCAFPTSGITLYLSYDKGEVDLKVKDMKKKERTIGIIMAILISAVMGVLAAFLIRKGMSEEALASTPAVPMFISNVLESIVVGVIVALVVPLGKWGKALAAKCKATPPGIKFTLLNCIPLSLGNALIVSTVVSLINVIIAHGKIPAEVAPPLIAMWLPSWLGLLPMSIIVSYLLAVILSPLVVQIVGVPAGGPPADAPKA